MMKMKALDTVHISEIKADSIKPGEEFEASEATANELVERGLAVAVKNLKPAKKKGK